MTAQSMFNHKSTYPFNADTIMALATLGILSLGDMGVGIAKLLTANNYRVLTNATGRRYVKLKPTVPCPSRKEIRRQEKRELSSGY